MSREVWIVLIVLVVLWWTAQPEQQQPGRPTTARAYGPPDASGAPARYWSNAWGTPCPADYGRDIYGQCLPPNPDPEHPFTIY